MKTIYRRFMIPAALVLFCALLMVATVFQYQARAQMRHNNYENLEATATPSPVWQLLIMGRPAWKATSFI